MTCPICDTPFDKKQTRTTDGKVWRYHCWECGFEDSPGVVAALNKRTKKLQSELSAAKEEIARHTMKLQSIVINRPGRDRVQLFVDAKDAEYVLEEIMLWTFAFNYAVELWDTDLPIAIEDS